MPAPIRLLLIEDDALFRQTVRETLVAAGYEVDEAADGVEALERVRNRRYDLALLDFDLPRMMGDETLERMLQIRPGLICFVLSGKDDPHQALWMGRRGAYGWIDKYVGAEQLLDVVAQGLRTRPRHYDLFRLIVNYYPQPIAVPYVRLARLGGTSSEGERLDALRELFESLVEFLGIAAVMTYLRGGLLEEPTNTRLLRAIEHPSTAAWFDVVDHLRQTFNARSVTWWLDITDVLSRPLAASETLETCHALIQEQLAMPLTGDPRTPWGCLEALLALHSLWLLPTRLPAARLRPLADAIDAALRETLAALSPLADAEILHVRHVSIGHGGEQEHDVAALSGLTIQSRRLQRAAPLRAGEMYLIARGTGEFIAELHPLLIYGACEAGSVVPQGVFALNQLAPDERALYLSHGCGHVRLVNDPDTLEAIRHLFYCLQPQSARYSHLLRDVAVALFDMSGYTQLTRERGPAVAREFVRRMVSTVRDAVERRGGQIGGFVGDEVLAYFDSPRSAVLAAADTLRTLEVFNARNPDAALHLHVGLDFGQGVVEGNQVWGDVINRAKRLQMLAESDEIAISSEMAAAIDRTDGLELEKTSGELKGFGPAEAYLVKWRRES